MSNTDYNTLKYIYVKSIKIYINILRYNFSYICLDGKKEDERLLKADKHKFLKFYKNTQLTVLDKDMDIRTIFQTSLYFTMGFRLWVKLT